MNNIKERILTIFNTSKKRRLAVIAVVMIIICIFAGLAAVNIFFFKTERSAYKEVLARIDIRADLITGELTFIDAQTTEIPTDFKEVTILPAEISENGFADDPETTAIYNAAVTLTIPATWETYNGFLFHDSTRTEEKVTCITNGLKAATI